MVMKARDYEAVASALRATLPVKDRLRVYRHMVPALEASQPRFNPSKFGESLGLPRLLIDSIVELHTTKEEVTPCQ
jgi:hypothetical protein